MSISKQRLDFLQSDAAAEFKAELLEMTKDSKYNTQPSYSSNTPDYPDNKISFVEKHLEYIASHPATDPKQYLANLKLKTKIF